MKNSESEAGQRENGGILKREVPGDSLLAARCGAGCDLKNDGFKGDFFAMSKLNVRGKFPFFENNEGLVYLDSASTMQKPRLVIDAVEDYLVRQVSNPGRGNYDLANTLANKVNVVRRKVAKFVGAADVNEVVFTSGATESLMMMASSWGHDNLKDGDEVLVNFNDHESLVKPWMNLVAHLQEKHGINVKLKGYKVSPFTGEVDLVGLKALVSEKTRVVLLTHVHNVYGVVNEVEEVRKLLPEKTLVLLDAAQSVGHLAVNVVELGVDMMAFSGHKMGAMEGSGGLYVRGALHDEFKALGFADAGLADGGSLQEKLERGTQNLAAMVSLGAAVDFWDGVGMAAAERHLTGLVKILVAELSKIQGVEFLPGVAFCSHVRSGGIVAFKLAGKELAEAAFVLNQAGFCVRTGGHCAYDSLEDSIRVSFQVYNEADDVMRLVEVLKQIW